MASESAAHVTDATDAPLLKPPAGPADLQELMPGVSGKGRYEVVGPDVQILHLLLSPGEKVLAENGSMMAMDPSVTPGVDCSAGCTRCCSGESCFFASYTNGGIGNTILSLTPNFPSKGEARRQMRG